MANAWSAFYWADYIADTGHLSLTEHGAYLLLMAHYYRTRRPLPANASVLHRICRCTSDTEKSAVAEVLEQFFTLDADSYWHRRINQELRKAADISEKRRAAAKVKHEKSRASAGANADEVQMPLHTQSQSPLHPHSEKSKAYVRPTLEEVTSYCQERGNQIDPQQWFNHYSANGWKVGRNPMKDWKAAVRTWENNGVNHANGNGKNGNRAAQRTADNIAALNEAFPLDR